MTRVPPPVAAGLLAPLLASLLAVAAAPPARADGEPEARRTRIVEAVARARPAVVAIHTTELVPQSIYGMEILSLPPMSREGLGSGVIFHPAGYVVTNAHVIARASQVLVDLAGEGDGSAAGATVPLNARILVVDVPNDLALLKLVPPQGRPPEPFPYLPLGRSDDLMLGETVIAVGNPYGLGFTVTTGVLSGMGRRLPPATQRSRMFEDFLQMDAAVNPGNSGGPLLDITGRWIGVTTAILRREATGAEGIGFAIPADRVRGLIGRAFKPRLLTGEWNGIEEEEGPGGAPAVRWVFPKGPAVGSGLKPGDVITSLNGEPVTTLFEYRLRVASLEPGKPTVLGISRGGEPLPAPVSLALTPVPTDELSRRHLGVSASDVDEVFNRENQIPFDAGVIVREVLPEGPADRIRLRAGDLIVGLGSYKIRNLDDLLVFLQYVQPEDLVKIRIRRLVSRTPDGRMLWDDKDGALVAR